VTPKAKKSARRATGRPAPGRKGGRHPDASRTVVRLTDPAVEDLAGLMRKDPQIARWALKKMIQLESDPEAGLPLVGDLIGWRKLTVGNRDWRIVWRVTHDESGEVVVDVAEVWAAGARSDGEVYAEMTDRVRTLPDSPRTTALADLVSRFGKLSAGLYPAREPEGVIDPPPTLPQWLRDRLIEQVGLRVDSVDALTLEEAVDTWTAWSSRPTE
jgi:mRNA interferase RelE/StbE